MIILRRIDERDAQTFCDLFSCSQVQEYLFDDIPMPYTIKRALSFIDQVMAEFPLSCAIQVDDCFAGMIMLGEKQAIYCANLELSYWLGAPFWNRGIMTEAIRQMLNVAFAQAGIHRVYAQLVSCNEASKRVLRNNGFLKEAIMADAGLKHGRPIDMELYAITKTNYKAQIGD